MKNVAIIRVRGTAGVEKSIADTLRMLNLNYVNSCVVVPRNETFLGMLKKVKDYVTWGEISDEVGTKLTKARSEKKIIDGKEVTSKVFRLHPPRGGYERKGIKKDFKIGGAIGYRAEKINALIEKML